MPKNSERVMELARQLAYNCASSDIGSYCYGYMREGKQWLGTNVPRDSGPRDIRKIMQQDVDNAIEYLELRGLIERHPNKPWVHILEPEGK